MKVVQTHIINFYASFRKVKDNTNKLVGQTHTHTYIHRQTKLQYAIKKITTQKDMHVYNIHFYPGIFNIFNFVYLIFSFI